jgi:hypothetical protein
LIVVDGIREAAMEGIDQLKQAAEVKRRESTVLSRAYSTTLSTLAPANFLFVVGAALLSLIAGATILVENNFLTRTQSGLLALLSGALTIIHSKLGCEQYQAECRKLLSVHRGIAEDYRNLEFVDDVDELRKRFFTLNDQLSAVVKSSSHLPFDWTITNAKKRLR